MSNNLNMIDTRDAAKALKVGLDYIQRRVTDPADPEYIPNVKIGHRRLIRPEDLSAWIDNKRTTKTTATNPSS